MIPSKYLANEEREYWDADITRASEKSLAKFMRAMIYCVGHLHDSFALGPESLERVPWGARSVFTRISLPKSAKVEFETMAEIKLKRPPVVQIN